MWHAVARARDHQPGDVIAVDVDGGKMVVGRDGDRYFAAQRWCVHSGGDLSLGIVSRGHLVCANHGWRFACATGRQSEASDVCLVVYSVRVNGEAIEIDPNPQTLRGF